jgi:hypothetical protein
MYPSSAGAGAVSPSMPLVLSLIRGGGSGPGTASNGGSVPLTPTTDDTAPFEYHHFTSAAAGGSNHSFSRAGRSGSIGYADGADDEDENEDEDEEDRMTMALPRLGTGGSPRRGVGVTRTPKKRRSTTIAAGPSAAAAAAGNTRSRSGTMVNGGAGGGGGGGGAASAGLVPSNGLSGGSLTMSPVDIHGSVSASMGLGMGMGMLVSSASSSASASGSPVNTNTSNSTTGTNGVVNSGGVGGQANSPLAMKELSPAHRPMIESYLNRYLNYLCVNREFSISVFYFPLFSSFFFLFLSPHHPPLRPSAYRGMMGYFSLFRHTSFWAFRLAFGV